MIATDHSPHTLEEKGCDINGRMMKPAIWDCISGFCGVETNVPLILTQVRLNLILLVIATLQGYAPALGYPQRTYATL